MALGVAAGFCVWTLLAAKAHVPSKLNHRLMLPVLMAAGIILCYGLLTVVLTLLAPSVAPGPLDNVNLLEFPAHLMTEASAEQKVTLDGTPTPSPNWQRTTLSMVVWGYGRAHIGCSKHSLICC